MDFFAYLLPETVAGFMKLSMLTFWRYWFDLKCCSTLQYIHLIRESGIQERIFRELQMLQKNHFDHGNPKDHDSTEETDEMSETNEALILASGLAIDLQVKRNT